MWIQFGMHLEVLNGTCCIDLGTPDTKYKINLIDLGITQTKSNTMHPIGLESITHLTYIPEYRQQK